MTSTPTQIPTQPVHPADPSRWRCAVCDAKVIVRALHADGSQSAPRCPVDLSHPVVED